MDNAVRYINKICELYNLSEDTKKTMLKYIDKVVRMLGDFTWTEIESAIAWYYANRSQTKQPRLIELNSWLLGRKKPVQSIPKGNIINRISTTLGNTFKHLVKNQLGCENAAALFILPVSCKR